jgi:hypothetical protein
MGIIKLTKFFNEYVNSLPKLHNQIISEICYIDYTANLVITTSNISKKYLKHYAFNSNKSTDYKNIIHDICNQIIDTCVNNIIDQVENNKYFKKYIIVFDYKFISKFNSKFQFNDNLLNDYISQLKFTKDHIDSIPMIPKNLNISTTPITILKESVRNLYELRLKNLITEYQNLYLLLENTPNDSEHENEKTIIQSIITFGLYRYIVLRGAKNNTRRDRGIKTMCKTIHSRKSFMEFKELGNILDNINVRLYYSLCQSENLENFNLTLNNFKNTVNYTLIVNLIPILVSKIKSKIKEKEIKTQIDFIGCENESDFVIRKHILLYNSLNCPTIYTTDSDLFMLLSDINCYIRIKSSNLNIRIKPNLFWQWLTGLKNIYLNDIIAFCCILGNDYNHFKFTKYKVETVEEIRELFKNNKNLYLNIYNHAIKLYQKYKLQKMNILLNNSENLKNENSEYKMKEYKTSSYEFIDELLHFLISLDIYKQCDLIENEIHYISTVNKNMYDKLIDEAIELKYRNIFTDNF